MSQRSLGSNFGGGGEDSEEEVKKQHPYDSIFGKKVNTRILEKDVAVAKLSLAEFQEIVWPNKFPSIIIDIIEYLTLLSITNTLDARA